MRVAVVSSQPYAPPWSEGVRNLIRRMAHDFTQRGAEVTVIGPETPMTITCGDAGERVVNVSAAPNVPERLRGITQIIVWLATARAVQRLDPEPDILLLVASVSSALGLRTVLLKMASRRPLVVYVTGLGCPRVGYHWGLSADRILVGSPFLLKWFPDASVIYPFLPLNAELGGAKPDRQSDTFNVLFLGSFEPEWGVEYLLRAMGFVKERTEKRVKLIIAWNGFGADNYENIQHLIETLGIRPVVDLRGIVNTGMVYREADILVIPRASQERMAFPVRIVEALHMHKPMVVTRICGMEDLIEGCGLAVEPCNADALAQAILNLAHDSALRGRLEANCARAARRFDSRVALDKLFNELRAADDYG